MRHTDLTPRTWCSYTITIFLTGLISVGYGAVDLVMVAHKGAPAIAAVGLGEIIAGALFALLGLGIVDSLSAHIASEEGCNNLENKINIFLGAMVVLLIPATALGLLIASTLEPILQLFVQDDDIVTLTSHYTWIRLISLPIAIVFMLFAESLKICGLKSWSLLLLIVGFGANAALNGLVLYTPLETIFPSPLAAISTTTTIVQICNTILAGWVLYKSLKQRKTDFRKPSWTEIYDESATIGKSAPGIGIRHFNDYIGTIAVIFLLGTFGVETLAAVTVATKIWSLYCRIPQACVSGTFVFYAYAIRRSEKYSGKADLRETAQRLLRYAMIPTYLGALILAFYSPLFISIFASDSLNKDLTRYLLLAFLITVPVYLIEKNYGEMLTVKGRGRVLAVGSSFSTYLIAIPLATIGTFWLESPVFVILAEGISSLVLALIFHKSLQLCEFEENYFPRASLSHNRLGNTE